MYSLEGDDHRRDLEIDVTLLDLDRQHLRKEQHRDAVEVGHRGAQRDHAGAGERRQGEDAGEGAEAEAAQVDGGGEDHAQSDR